MYQVYAKHATKSQGLMKHFSAVPPGGEDSPKAAAGLCGILGVQCTSPDSGHLCRGHKKG